MLSFPPARMRSSTLEIAAPRLPRIDFRGRIVGLAALGAAAPLGIAAACGVGPYPLATGLGAVILCLAAVSQLLSPVRIAAQELRACADGDGEAPADPRRADGDSLLDDVRRVSDQLEVLRDRLKHRHPITKLPTREPFLSIMSEDMRGPQTSVLALIRFGDYDRLAAFDQDAADRVLTAFAARLAAANSSDRPLAHIDRDVFALWFAGVEEASAAAAEMQAIAAVLAEEIDDGEVKVTPDIGLGGAIHPDDGADPQTLILRATAALPKPGQMVAGKLNFFSAQSSTAARARFSLEQSLRQAIARDQLLLHFQPVVDLAAGKVIGAEALLRWRHPDRGLVSPGEFIPILEETGMMDEVGLWVLNTACGQVRTWEDNGLSGLKMAVNLSARQFHDPTLNQTILGALKRHGLAPERLELELTETATMEDAKHTRQLFGELRSLGVSVAIDDFGTGYSSLSYLKNLPFSKLKIDREFVTEVHQRRDSHAICTALVELARGLDILVLAEGVETREEADALRRLGCSMFQGFFFARPLAAEDFVTTVSDPEWLEALASPARRQRAALQRRLNS